MNRHASINTLEATEHLKNILNVGKNDSDLGKIKTLSNGNMEETTGDENSAVNDKSYQKIELCVEKDSSHYSIFGSDVDVYSSPLVYNGACSQIIVEDMVDFGWEEKYYHGKLVSIHLSGKYLAYVLKPSDKPGFVRVFRLNSDWRHLIKDYKTEVKDIAFAHTTNQILLGSVDACGEFLVHKIEEEENIVLCNLLVRITRPSSWLSSDHNRIIWCLYIPEDPENESTAEDDSAVEEVSSLLVVTHNERAEIWNIHTIIKEHGFGNLSIDEVKVGVQVISEHKMPISAATFSPDGTALAIGSLDGVVKFFQVNTLKKDISPRCLHQWIPHDNKSLSSLYFLDNHKNHRPDIQFWKFAVTGAENNTELKVWSCETWACLQTIRIHSNASDRIQPCFKVEMDLSSKYLILSDIKRKVLLILMVQQDPSANTAFFKSISEFRVPLPVLSLAISSVGFAKFPSIFGNDNSEDEEDNEQVGDVLDSEEIRNKVIVKLFWIQTKKLQSCRIAFKPALESPLHSVGSVSSLSQDSFGFKDGLSDISMDVKDSSSHTTRDLDSLSKGLCVDKLAVSSASNLNTLTSHITYPPCTEVLLTPDDFTSPSHSNLSAPSSFTHHEEIKNPVSKCDLTTCLPDSMDSLPVESTAVPRRKSSQHSATSSPSREVAEIMAPTKDEINLETSGIQLKNDVEILSSNLNSFTISNASLSTRNQQEYHMKEWPQAPDPTKEYPISSRNESDSISHNNCFLSNKENSKAQFEEDSNHILLQLNHKIDAMVSKIEDLTEMSNNHRKDIQVLQNDINSLQDQKNNQLNTNLSNKLDIMVSQHLVPGYSRLENLILKCAEDEQKRTERELTAFSSDISSTFNSKLDSTLRQELSSILPQINTVLDAVAQKMFLDFSQKLAATDVSVKEMFHKYFKGKVFSESLAQNIASSLQNVIQSVCKEVFQSSVIPAFEKSCQNLFHQLNELFHKGTLEYIQILEKNASTSIAAMESSSTHIKEEIHNLLTSTQQTMHNHASQIENRNIELIKQRENILANLRQIVNEELRKVLKEQQASVLSSRSVTPVPHNDPMLQKQLLMQLVKQGNLNEAFQQALSAMDVHLVLFLCESVNVDRVFGQTPCPLQQHVLLSLVNQLSADLPVKTETKVRYIEDVIASLDSNDPIIKDHICSVLEDLQQRIAGFLQKYPNHKFARNMKRISLAAQSLIK